MVGTESMSTQTAVNQTQFFAMRMGTATDALLRPTWAPWPVMVKTCWVFLVCGKIVNLDRGEE